MRKMATLGFETGSITLLIEGYGNKDGSGRLCVDENEVRLEPYADREGYYFQISIDKQDMIELKDWFNKYVKEENS